jgi:hypothetical protein
LASDDGACSAKSKVIASQLAPATGCGVFFGLELMFPHVAAMHASWHVALARQPWHAKESFGHIGLHIASVTPHFATFVQTSVHVTLGAGAFATCPPVPLVLP